jgi:hypothetical protein
MFLFDVLKPALVSFGIAIVYRIGLLRSLRNLNALQRLQPSSYWFK